jgi:hypothetical protein
VEHAALRADHRHAETRRSANVPWPCLTVLARRSQRSARVGKIEAQEAVAALSHGAAPLPPRLASGSAFPSAAYNSDVTTFMCHKGGGHDEMS